MKRKLKVVLVIVMCSVILVACAKASRVEHNLTKEADNFNIVRKLTVINCIQNEVLFQMTGRMSITQESVAEGNRLKLIVELDDGHYVKHFVGLSDNVTYIIEDLNLGENDVKNYKYTLKANPKMWFPVDVELEE